MAGESLVSAIIPTYNRLGTICAAIDSVLAQTYSPIEIIVVDDGSTDDTIVRLSPYKDKIRIFRQENAGVSAARNAGVRVSQGPILSFLDSDDTWLPKKIERQVALLEAAGTSVACCISNAALHFNNGKVRTSFDSAGLHPPHVEGVWLNPAEVLATRFLMVNQGLVVRREEFDRAGGFQSNLKVLEDYDLALKLSLRGPWVFTSEPLTVWKQGEDSLSHVLKHSPVFREAWCRILDGAVANMSASSDYATACNLAVSAVRSARREIAAYRLCQSKRWLPKTTGRAYLESRMLFARVFRHSPWYPTMKTSTLAEYRSSGQLSENEQTTESSNRGTSHKPFARSSSPEGHS